MKLAILQNKRRNWRYWLRLTLFFIVTLTLALAGLPLMLGSLFMVGLLYSPCAEGQLTPDHYGLMAESVTIQARDSSSFQGYFIPGTNGATIIMPPPLASDRSVRLPEAAMLSRHGFGVITFESRRCAGLGPLSLGYHEVAEVADVVGYLVTREDIDSNRIGIYGFSSAGATSIMATSRLPKIRAVVAEGGYGDFAEDTLGRNNTNIFDGYFLALFRWASHLTYRTVTGLDIGQLSPVSEIGEIAPRPILLIYGSREVSLAAGQRQKAAAGENAQLWIVDGAGHGNYATIAPEAYEARIVTFFDRALLERER